MPRVRAGGRFKVDGPGFSGAKTGAFLEVDFYGDNSAAAESPQPRLRHVYGTIDWPRTQVLFGQYWDMFAPMIASTPRTSGPPPLKGRCTARGCRRSG